MPANQDQNQTQTRAKGTIAKGERTPPPNWRCYTTVFVVGENIDEHGNWLGGRLPQCRVCQGLLPPQENHVCPGYMPRLDGRLVPMDLDQRSAMREASWEEAGDWDDDQYDATTDADIPAVVKFGEDWDDDQFDPTTPEGADFMLHEAETGETKDNVVLEGWDEDRWMAWKRQQLGYSKDYDPTLDYQGEELDWEDEEYEDEDE